ncbi:MAG: hypothetical protein RLZZ165_1346 [Bacteroidota bacterium]|jgi:nucleotidyltransferase substrate binding protein (TIGR01987 family)
MEQDIRWKQRLANFESALARLAEGIAHSEAHPLAIVKEGVLQRFEFTHELAWKVMKDFLEYEGVTGIVASRSATREAFHQGLIANGQEWMNMIDSRNATVHTYEAKILEDEFSKVTSIYFQLLKDFHQKMSTYL